MATFSMDFHGKYIHRALGHQFPLNSMEFHGGISHGGFQLMEWPFFFYLHGVNYGTMALQPY